MSQQLTATVPSTHFVKVIGPVDGVDLHVWDLSGDLPAGVDPSYVVVPEPVPEGGLERIAGLGRLEVLQGLMAGYDHLAPHLPAGVKLCNAAGVHDDATAEHALTLILTAQRGIPELVRAQDRAEWVTLRRQPGLADKKVLVIGYGRIGRAITARLLPFKAQITAVASAARDGDDLVERVHGIDELADLLPAQDVVVLITPLTPTTKHLVNADFLARMREGALLVNVARGAVVDTDALLAATRAGNVRAAVDVTDPEPLPGGHPLFGAPGVLVTPHLAGLTDALFPRAAAMVRGQLTALAAGRDPDHVVMVG